MAFKKFSKDAATKTHGEVDASMVDVLMPHTELVGSGANTIRSAAYGAVGYVAATKKHTGNWLA